AQNNTRSLVWPEIRIYLFNALGIQVGGAAIGTQEPTALKTSSLGVGEVRSYAGSLELIDPNEAPRYFLVRIPESDLMPDPSLPTTEDLDADARAGR
ncbi:hypothetical protein RZS08_11300, partial [Arthrospira platensis SPKY1]|nr:hypothetical protein [Arthrospira platensis SPKY1]